MPPGAMEARREGMRLDAPQQVPWIRVPDSEAVQASIVIRPVLPGTVPSVAEAAAAGRSGRPATEGCQAVRVPVPQAASEAVVVAVVAAVVVVAGSLMFLLPIHPGRISHHVIDI